MNVVDLGDNLVDRKEVTPFTRIILFATPLYLNVHIGDGHLIYFNQVISARIVYHKKTKTPVLTQLQIVLEPVTFCYV